MAEVMTLVVHCQCGANPSGETEDELVPFARVVEELGWPAYKVRLAMGKAGNKLRKAKATRHSRVRPICKQKASRSAATTLALRQVR